ncbi:hypothetical protein C8R46DRAFT_1191923 [Mycena filopes]|nr:hypothetical protein C8R46DRAFT_1191923 [Mycena filopes]
MATLRGRGRLCVEMYTSCCGSVRHRQSASASSSAVSSPSRKPGCGTTAAGMDRFLLQVQCPDQAVYKRRSQRGTWAPAQTSKAVAPFPMAAAKQMPTATRKVIAEYTGMLNIPPLGLPGNTAHNTLQVNVAPAVEHGSEETLAGSLGFYGGNHNDTKDSPARFTNMVICKRRANRAFTERANFAVDGQIVMDVRAHLPLSYDIRIDSDRFLSAFSFIVDPDGTREAVGPWFDGPAYRAPDTNESASGSDVDDMDDPPEPGADLIPQDIKRSRILRDWRLHFNKHAIHIPYAVVHEKIFEINADGDLRDAAPQVSDRFDVLGNPLEPGGRTYSKPAPPMSKKKGAPILRLLSNFHADHFLLSRAKGKRARKGKAVEDDDSTNHPQPERKRRKTDVILGTKARRAIMSSVMQITYLVWHWLDSYCVNVIVKAFDDPTADSWIGRLARLIHTLMDTRAPTRVLVASEYGLELDSTFEYRHRARLDVEVPRGQVVAVVLQCIGHWLNFPTTTQSRAQAWFVDTITRAFDPLILLLDSVWYAYGHLNSEVFAGRNTQITAPAAFLPLANALKHCPLATPSSEERLLLAEMGTMAESYRTGRMATLAPSSSPPRLRLTDSDSAEVRMMNRFLDALLELEPLLDGYENIAQPTRFQAVVNGKRDFLLPFREHAPSRVRSRLPGNSFDPVHARSLAGLFSGLIFRAVIFATPFSLEATTHFSAPAAWTTETTKFAGKPESFFCNLSAYSRRKSNRGRHLVSRYWTTINDPGCPNWETNTREGLYDFAECFAFLTASRPKPFPEIGVLIAFLLTADFSYAGAVKAPSVGTVATMIRTINAGGMAGLEQLQLIPLRPTGLGVSQRPNLGDVSQVKAGLTRLYDFLHVKLPSASKTRMGFDAIMVENSLCKWTRWVKLKFVSLKL